MPGIRLEVIDMEFIKDVAPETLLLWLGSLVVFLAAMARFNDPVPLAPKSPENMPSWLGMVRNWFRWQPNSAVPLYLPTRANTTLFKYRVYQVVYAILALFVYWLFVKQPAVLHGVQDIIRAALDQGLLPENIPFLGLTGPLVIAAFVLLVLPNLPPFKGADLSIRRMLYRRASIPAQQLREMNRLMDASYTPPAGVEAAVRTELIAEGFRSGDIQYNQAIPTTQSLWTKCAVLIRQIKALEANDEYKTAFAILLEPSTGQRSVEAVKAHYHALVSDAKACFSALHDETDEDAAAIEQRVQTFRTHCKQMLELIYCLLSRVSLHAHYSDNQRVNAMRDLGFQLHPTNINPIPDANEVIALILILGTVFIAPLSTAIGATRALLVGAIMFTAVLTPIILAYLCPRLAAQNGHHAPALAFPVFAAIIAGVLGMLIMTLGGYLAPATGSCPYVGFERYINCSYPWSVLHAGMAVLIAWRMRVGNYPDISALRGFKRYKIWGSLRDSVIFLAVMLILVVLVTEPMLQKLGREFTGDRYLMLLVRLGLVAAVIGFFVPTWYRAQQARRTVDRRVDWRKRQRFAERLAAANNNLRSDA